MFYWETKAGSK